MTETQIPPQKKKMPKYFWIFIGIFIVYMGYNLIFGLSHKDEQLCIYEIPASIKWNYTTENGTHPLIERNINLWKYEVALKEYGLVYVGEGDDSTLKNFTNFYINYCNLNERRNITIPFEKRAL